MEQELEKLKTELEECRRQADDYLNGWKRAKADFINREREVEKERELLIKFANYTFAAGLLSFVDSFHAGLGSMPAELSESEWAKGFHQLANQLEETLKKMGVEAIDSSTHQFNPLLHECVGTEKHEEAGKVLKEVQRGYLLNGRVLRPTKVIVGE